MESPPVLEAVGLHKSYGRGDAIVHAVRGIDLRLYPGEVVAIMGASGSGKTTLLHLLGGLANPDDGSIRIGEVEIRDLADGELTRLRREKIGLIFQAFNLVPTLSAIDNVALPLLLGNRPRAEAREAANAALKNVGLGARADHRPSQMSGGEQQRAAIARALVTNPPILLADEPTGNLDKQNAENVCDLLHGTAVSPDRCVVLVTHDPHVAFGADRIVVLRDGRVVDTFKRADTESREALSVRAFRAASVQA